jgi:hypothetical protein
MKTGGYTTSAGVAYFVHDIFSTNIQILRIWVNKDDIALIILMPEASHVYRKIGIEGHSTPAGVVRFIHDCVFYKHTNPPDLGQ